MNIDKDYIGMLQNMLGEEYVKEILTKQYEAEKEKENKFKEKFTIELEGKSLELALKKTVTAELRHKLRGLAKEYPKEPLKACIAEFDIKNTEVKVISLKMQEFVKTYPQFTLQDMIDNNAGTYINETHEYNLDAWFMKYFQAILSMDVNSKPLIDGIVMVKNKINGLWNTIDMMTVREAVEWFRRIMGI
jgi:hypothetical protein